MSITEQFKQVFSNDYCGFNTFFEKVLAPLFGDKIERKNEDLLASGNYHDKAERLKIKTMTYVAVVDVVNAFEPIHIIDITVDNSCHLERSRVYIKELVRQMLENYANAFIIFHYAEAEGKPWRFSYMHKDGKQDDVTAAKRFTYVFGRNYSGRTAAERFTTLQGKPMETQDFENAFSVEALSKEFFNEYKQQYERFCQFLYANKTNTDYFGEAFTTWDDKVLRDYVKKMLGRLVFIQFLHRKGWAPDLLDAYNSHPELQDNFLDAYLEPLFGGVLNTQPDRRADEFSRNANRGWNVNLIDEFTLVPYLNGGLFESDMQDPPRSRFPKEYFKELLEFFARYNFTIDENDPQEAEIGVDPEMLGRIFENLLEDNKDKGAFYTPKEIVQYMCRESLIAYLNEKLAGEKGQPTAENAIRQFVTTHVLPSELRTAANEIKTALDNVKICDPAIGSGAFPMGLLNELVAQHEALEFESDSGQQHRADIKKHIIQNSIYGVDIEKGAVDIARLRFWLSIVVDEDTPQPLPNLDYKIMQGNSLLEQYSGKDLSRVAHIGQAAIDLNRSHEAYTGDLFADDNLPKELQTLLSEYYRTPDHQRKQLLRAQIADNVRKQLPELPADIDIAANTHFFLWHTWFADVFANGGFDIVIGNPPYGVSIKGDYRKEVTTHLGNVPDYEIYYYFIQNADIILKDDGILSYIIPNTYLFNNYAKNYRLNILNNWNVIEILDCTKFKIFESATVFNTINTINTWRKAINNEYETIGYRKTSEANSFESLISKPRILMNKKDLINMNQNWGLAFALTPEKITIVNNMSNQQHTIGSEFPEISQGLIAYDKYQGQTEEIIKSRAYHYRTYKPGLKKWLWGEDVKRYELEWNGEEYIDYCDGIANPRKPKFFINKRLLIREITNPSIYATIVSEELYNDPAIIIVLDNDNFPVEVALAILNSKLATFYHFNHSPKATKGAFPKILVQDIKDFPLPTTTPAQQQPIIELVDKILAAKKADPAADTSAWEAEIDNLVYNLYGLTEEEVRVVKGE